MRTIQILALIGAVVLTSAITQGDLTQQTKLTADDGTSGDNFGRSVSLDGDYAVVGAYNDDTGSAYIFQRTGSAWTQQAKLTADDGVSEDYFGREVSISGDYAVVGAWGDDDNGTQSGSAYVFLRTGSTWTQQDKLTADDAAEGDWFGYSVSVSGDYAVVGAYRDADDGSAYVFHRTGSTWTQQAKLTADDVTSRFGGAVSISGDYAVVGAYFDDDNGTQSGAAYLFERTGSTWTQQAKLTASDGAEYDYFGSSVSIDGDHAIVGAFYDDDNGSGSGSAYIFEKPAGGWEDMTQTAKLTAGDGDEWDALGVSVSIDGDYAVVGAYGDNDNDSDSGSAYIFEKPVGGWEDMTHADKLTASDGAISDSLGVSVSIDGDYAFVGAHMDDDNDADSGSAYVYAVPEPATLTLLALGGITLLRRKSKQTNGGGRQR